MEEQCDDPALVRCGLEKCVAADGTVEWVAPQSKERFARVSGTVGADRLQKRLREGVCHSSLGSGVMSVAASWLLQRGGVTGAALWCGSFSRTLTFEHPP